MDSIGRGSVYVFSGKLAMMAFGALTVTLIPRFLGPENMGFYSYWLSVLFVLFGILDLGGYHTLIRYVPELRSRNEDSVKTLIRKTLEIKFPLVVLLFIAGSLYYSREKGYFFIIFMASVFMSANYMVQAGLYAYKDMKNYALLQLFKVIFRLVLVIGLFTVFGAIGILYGIFSGGVFATIIFGFLFYKLLPRSSAPLERPFKEYAFFGLFVYLAILLYFLITWFPVILAEAFITDLEQIGYLGLAQQICLVSLTGMTFSLGESLFPSLVELRVSNTIKFRRSLEMNWKYTNLIMFPMVFGFFAMAKPLIELVVGVDFLPAVVMVQVFLPAAVFLTWSRIHQQILLVYEKKTEIFLLQLSGFAVFLLTGILLIKEVGIMGAPISVVLGSFVGYLVSHRFSTKCAVMENHDLHLLRPLAASVVMFLPLNFMHIEGLAGIVGGTVLGAGIYFVSLYLIKGIDAEDIERVRACY